MADSVQITANVVDGFNVTGNVADGATVTSSVTERVNVTGSVVSDGATHTANIQDGTAVVTSNVVGGAKGDKGDKGDPGAGLAIIGTLAGEGDLPAEGSEGDAYIITGDLYVWSTSEWVNVGQIKGDTGPAGNTGANGIDGDDGREVELQKSATHIQWRYVGEVSWTNLVALADIKGDTGAAGSDGSDGYTPVKNVDYFDGEDGYTPVKDVDYFDGSDGADGAAATIAVGTVTTGAAGSSATVTNVGTSSAAVFDITIPKGDTGASGSGSGDMAAATYDPTAVAGDAFSMGNMAETATKKILTDTERTKLAGIASGATANTGDVVGPASATDNAVVRYDGTSGKLAQNSGVTIDDSNNFYTPAVLESGSIMGAPTVAADSIEEYYLGAGVSVDGVTLKDGLVDGRDVASDGTKLDGIATAATANDTDANLKNRANHTGTQTAATISDFNTAADARIAAETSTGTGTNVRATSPTLVTPNLGTPSAVVLTNATGFPTLNQNTTGSAATLTTGRTFRTNLASTSTATFDGSANVTPGVMGTLALGNGGTGTTTAAGIAALVGNLLMPIGFLYVNRTNSANPSTYLGFGTWVAVTDKMIMARGSTYTADGGSATHTHDAGSIVAQANFFESATRGFVDYRLGTGPANYTETNRLQTSASGAVFTTGRSETNTSDGIATAGTTTSSSNIPPNVVAYVWERTA